jgi:phospholipid/cholesterol/gamma-HCH transport system substrate-binding protein
LKKFVTPFRVGLLVLASAAFLFMFMTFVRKGGLSRKESHTYWALFHDASGLGKKSRVQIAGIQVGDVEAITLEGTLARVTIRVRSEVEVHENASVTKRSESLLGDYQLDLVPGSDDQPLIPEGGQIKHVIDQQGMEQIFNTLSAITADIQSVTSSLRSALGGEKGAASLERIVASLTSLSQSLDSTVRNSGERLNTILANVEGVSADVRGITQGQDAEVRQIVDNIKLITQDVRSVLATVKDVVGTRQGDFKESVSSLKDTMQHLDNSLANLEDVTTKIKEGKGAVGELVSDEHLGQRVSEVVEDLGDLADRVARLQLEVGIKSEYLFSQGNSKNTVGVKLIPKPDKYYLLEFVDDPRGSVNIETIQTNPPDVGHPVTQEIRTTSSSLKISAEFAKRYYFTTLRFGIIESTGGVGADLHVLNDALTFKVDAFNFSDRQLKYPRVRVTAQLQLLQHILLTAGADDILNRQVTDSTTNRLIAGRDFYLGGGVFFTDEDLKSLITLGGIPKP